MGYGRKDFFMKRQTGNRISIVLTASLLMFWMTGCAYFLGTDAPLDVLRYTPADGKRHDNLIVFLRGRGGSHRSFEKEGFVSAVRQRGLPFDMVAPNAHVGYYVARSFVVRLKADVIDPAKAEGYRRIWLVGASMGGMGALWYMRLHPGDVDGVYAISPFLGDPEIIDEIAEAGGVRNWSPGTYDPSEDWQRLLWDWLKTDAGNPDAPIPLYLGYGKEDRFVKAHRLLAAILPPERVYTADGGHDPETMRRVWLRFLDDGRLQ